MEKITKNEFLKELENFEGKEQYLFSTFKMNIENIIKTLEDNFDGKKHISSNYRLVKDIIKNSNSFTINGSYYYWQSFTNVYKIVKNWCEYYILHDTKNNGIVVYENLI